MEHAFFYFMLALIALFFAGLQVWRSCENLNSMEEMITRVFLGKPLTDMDFSLKPDVLPESFCHPLTADVLQRVHACTSVKRARVKVNLLHKMKMLAGIADLAVTYDFEGADPEGQTVIVQETARLRVHFDDPYNRYGWDTMVITEVEPF